ncbi:MULTISPECIES: spore germination protein GerPC [unclassified Mesobacillus]|uniref:spore germination protein GerPC n=1 Tax=unclassified Mesobacillus TaxID=2675270 RepID=UPI00203BA2A4|nr:MULTISPECIES: spore germination protein GerPC [unclassified Mesobacillus]MCM3124922.1 spore germination protein GerPC [Mesobacillus sp. MER 33]MCM3232769.1 spore germination protein GerPC [Mesobacillus sp. MER 48]
MNAEFYEYVKKLHLYVQHQSKKISKLEKMAMDLQQEVAALKDRPPVQIGNIEYKFDQLKVETLEGTLNIGLNPSELDGIEDFSVDQKAVNVPTPGKQLFKRTIEIETALYKYLETDLEGIYRDAQAKLGINVDDSYFTFIKEDIRKQLSGRVAAHLKERSSGENGTVISPEMNNQVIDLLKQEIQNGVFLFLKNLPDNVKEGRSE